MTPPEQETGQPIRLLVDQELEPSLDFMQRVRGKIYRRTATTQLAAYSWHLPRVILVEMASLVGHFVKAFASNKEP